MNRLFRTVPRALVLITLLSTAAPFLTGTIARADGSIPPVIPSIPAVIPAGETVTLETVTLELVNTDAEALDTAARMVELVGGTVESTTDTVLTIEIPAADEALLDRVIDDGVMREPLTVDVRPEGLHAPSNLSPSNLSPSNVSPGVGPLTSGAVGRIGADAWHQVGANGGGVTIGVIDYFDVPKYWNDAELGPRPTAASAKCISIGKDCTTTFFDGIDLGGESHGIAVMEVIRDVAPGARIVMGQARTLQDYKALIDWFTTQGVTVVSRSLGSRYDGPGDGRGDLTSVAEYAVSQGMLWVNSGGNNGDRKYLRQPVNLIDGWVSFGGTRYLEFNGAASIAGIRWVNDWDTAPAQRTNYDAFLYRAPAGRPDAGAQIASSTLDQTLGAPALEQLAGKFTPGAGEKLYLAIKWVGGDIAGDVIEVLDYADGINGATQSSGSGATPVVDSASVGVISVGAIDPPDSGLVALYSAQGPTTDGRTVPSLTAPAGYANSVWGLFSGTSAAAPVVGAAAAVLQSGGFASDPVSMGNLLRTSVTDRGAAGADNVYGAGELKLPVPPQFTAPIEAAESKFVPVAPTRILDTRPETATGPSHLIGAFDAGEVRNLSVTGVAGVAADATAVAVNVVTIAPDRPSFVQLLPTGQAQIGAYSNLNADAAGQIRANFAIVPVGINGQISVFNLGAGHIVVDILGYFAPTSGTSAGGRFVALTPQRQLDTRVIAPITPMTTGATRAVAMPSGVDAADVQSLVITVTATDATAPGWVQAYPTDQPALSGRTSTVNITAGSTVANTAIVPVGSAGVSVTAGFADNGSADVIVDVVGYITSERADVSSAGLYVPVRPDRAFDSRISTGSLAAGKPEVVAATDAPGVSVPSGASGIMWNIAIVGANRPGFAQSWAAGAPVPTTSSLNWSTVRETRASATIVAAHGAQSQFMLNDGGVDAATPVGDLVVDVFGYFT